MTRSRDLHDPGTGKLWSTHCDGNLVEIRTGLPGRERTRSLPQADAPAAVAYAMKKEWAKLKSGYVLATAQAPPGTPAMLRHLGPGGYTGALLAAPVGDRLLANRFDDGGGADRLLLIDRQARLVDSAPLPGGLAWQAQHVPALERVLVLADHHVVSFPLPLGAPAAVTAEPDLPCGTLSCAGGRAAWYVDGLVVVVELAAGAELLRLPVGPELVNGHSWQLSAVLSPDGGTLAACARPGEITVIDVDTGHVRGTIRAGFMMIVKMLISPDGRHLIAGERYGSWRWWCFDLHTFQARPDWPDLESQGDLAVEPTGARFVVTHRDRAQVRDLRTLEVLHSFPLDHVVRRCAVTWVGDSVGVVTDYGCAGVYPL